jgi:hypothetical protein
MLSGCLAAGRLPTAEPDIIVFLEPSGIAAQFLSLAIRSAIIKKLPDSVGARLRIEPTRVSLCAGGCGDL